MSNQKEETAYEALMRLQDYIDKSGNGKFDKGVNFGPAVSKKDIEKIEKKLNTQLSPSYVNFLVQHGTFHINGGSYKLLTPIEALKETNRQWKHYSKCLKDNPICDDSDGMKVFQLYFFQYMRYKSDHYVFNLDERFINGEMSVHPYHHEDIFYLATNRIDYNEHTSKLVDRLIVEDIQDSSIF